MTPTSLPQNQKVARNRIEGKTYRIPNNLSLQDKLCLLDPVQKMPYAVRRWNLELPKDMVVQKEKFL